MNDIRALIPPGFKDRAVSSNLATSYNLNIPQLYIHKNPAWHPLTINEADVLEPDVVMPRLNQDRLFAPDTEDVMLLEREVNIYRLQMRDDELEQLEEQRRELLRHLDDMQQDDFDDQLHELDAKIRARQQELNETERRMRELQAENERLERELATKQVVSVVQPPPPAPQPVRPVVSRIVEQPPVRQRSPGRNILPSVISGIPHLQDNRVVYNYEGERPGLNSSLRGDQILVQPVNIAGFVEGDRYGSKQSAVQVMRDSYTNGPPQRQVVASPQPTISRVVTQSGPHVNLPGRQQATGYTTVPTYQPVMQMQPSTIVRPGAQVPAIGASGTTYHINGQTYTAATLPPQYAHLRG